MAPTCDRHTPPAAERFQFGIRDLLLATFLAGLLSMAIARDSILLLYLFALVFGLLLTFVWKRPSRAKALVCIACVLLFFLFHWAAELRNPAGSQRDAGEMRNGDTGTREPLRRSAK